MRKVAFVLNIFFFLTILSCKEHKEHKEHKEINATLYFQTLEPDSTGIHFKNELTYSNELNIIDYLYYYNGGGVAIGDINNDGLDDVYLSGNQTTDKLYLNLGNLKFKDITEDAGLNVDSSWSTGVTMEDINNDGYLDIYVCKVGQYKNLDSNNLLYLNNGNNSFTEVAREYGIDFKGLSTQASFFDYDNDGDLDMYLLNHSIHSTNSYDNIEARTKMDSISGDRLFENKWNEGRNLFVDVTSSSGIYSSALGYGLAIKTSDINNDGLIDIYVGNDFHENDYLYINRGDKTFKESSSDFFNHGTRFTMGVDIADMNSDGLLDIFTLDMMPNNKELFLKSGGEDSDKIAAIKKNYGFNDQYARNSFQLNKGTHFQDVSLLTNTYATDWSWSVLLQDFDNDGLNDIYISNGIYKRPNDLDYINFLSTADYAEFSKSQSNDYKKSLIEKMPSVKLPNVVFKNNGNLNFSSYTTSAGQTESFSNGSAYSDLDLDGDLDIIINNINDYAFVLENKSASENNYVTIDLQPNDKIKNVSGSKVALYINNQTNLQELSVVRGFQSSSTRKLNFGLGKHKKIDSIKITWPNLVSSTHTNIPINSVFKISAPQEILQKHKTEKTANSSYNKFNFLYLENSYLDYEREGLMPELLSTEGPAAVSADFNNDGYLDMYIGGAKYQSAKLFLGKQDGTYSLNKQSSFLKDAIYEDNDVIALDLDNDEDLDLYVLSGGNENIEGSDYLEDRIYINHGDASFTRLPIDMFKTNGGSISYSDFNNDGHQDLFIGSRSIPGAYGLTPNSYILSSNGKGQFNLVTKLKTGMVTTSYWQDLNNDGFQDLIIAGDWMPISIYINNRGKSFQNKTKEFGLEFTNGLWNVIKVIDINGDSKPEIIAGNIGENFKWKASKDKPVHLYLDDFDDNSQLDPIIYYNFFENYVPFASKDKLSAQLPSLKKRFNTYNSFSKTNNILDLFPDKKDDILETKNIYELKSMVYSLDKNNIFHGKALPIPAQTSTIEDFYIDTNKQLIYFVGNYFGFVNELGNSDGNSGGIIAYNKDLTFDYLKDLHIPPFLNCRKIIPINNNQLMVIVNGNHSYIINKE